MCMGLLIAVVGGGCANHELPAEPARRAVPVVVIPTEVRPQRPLEDGYVPGVENFGFVSGELWRGARPTAEGFDKLAKMGVRTIIDLEQHDDGPELPAGVRYVALPVSGWHADQVDTEAVLAAIRDCPKPVFVHCHEGRDRTGLAVAAYRIQQGMSGDDAIEELHNFHVHPWWGYLIEPRVRKMTQQKGQ